MFNFLNSAVLIAAAAALIPLIIHLFSKRKVKVIEFSSLKHLKEMQKRQVRRLKIRQLLLLILRMLIILVAVLAFARPASKGGYIGSHAGVSSVILLDRSASMQREVKDGRLFDLAKRFTADILKNFGQSDELLLIPFDKECLFPAGERFFSREVAENILNDIDAGYFVSDLEIAYNKALELLANSKNLNKELYLISDRQLSSLPESIDTTETNITTYFVDLPVETDGNCGLTGIDLGGQLIEVGSAFNVKAEIKNYDSFNKTELLASLFVDGVRVMQTEFALEVKGVETVQFSHTVHSPGLHQGRVELSDDAFLADNKYFFSFGIPDRFNVLIIDGDNSGELIRLALVPSEKTAGYWSVKMSSSAQLANVRFLDYDVVVLAGVSSLGQTETSRLLKYVDNGGGLFVVAGGNLSTEYFNSSFADHLDVEFEKAVPAFFTGAGYYSLERFDYAHPIFKVFEAFERDPIPTLRFYTLPTLASGENNRKLAYYSNGDPALIEAEYGLGKIILMTAPINPKYTDLPSHSFFVPFVIRTAEYLAGSVSEYELKNQAGENVIRTLSGKLTDYGTIKMITPDNGSFNIVGTEKTGQITYDCRPIDVPGIYLLQSGNRTLDIFPVNIPTSESDLSAVEIDRLEAALNIDNSKTLPYSETIASIISTARFGRELWKIFLWAVVILLAVEMLFSREGEIDVKES